MASGVGGGWGGLEWGWEGAVVMIQDGAKLILAWGVCHGGGMLRSDVDPILA